MEGGSEVGLLCTNGPNHTSETNIQWIPASLQKLSPLKIYIFWLVCDYFACFLSFQAIPQAKINHPEIIPHKPLAGGLKFFPDYNSLHQVVPNHSHHASTESCWSAHELNCCLSESVWQICGSACVCPTSSTCQSCNNCLKCHFLLYSYVLWFLKLHLIYVSWRQKM